MIEFIMKFQGATEPVSTMAEIEAKPLSTYMMALCDNNGRVSDHLSNGDGTSLVGHIVITEPSSYARTPSFKQGKKEYKDVLTLTVLEATGQKGLVESKYLVMSVDKNGVFTVFRGSKGVIVKMKIVRLV